MSFTMLLSKIFLNGDIFDEAVPILKKMAYMGYTLDLLTYELLLDQLPYGRQYYILMDLI